MCATALQDVVQINESGFVMNKGDGGEDSKTRLHFGRDKDWC